MPIHVVVIGSKVESDNPWVEEQAREFGRLCALRGLVIVTGGGTGLPTLVAQACEDGGGTSIGVTAAISVKEHEDKGWPSIFSKLACLPLCFAEYPWEVRLKIRNVLLMNEADVIALFAGGWGTMTEFAINQSTKKPVFVLDSSGGFAGMIRQLEGALGKQAHVELCTDAESMVLAIGSLNALLRDRVMTAQPS